MNNLMDGGFYFCRILAFYRNTSPRHSNVNSLNRAKLNIPINNIFNMHCFASTVRFKRKIKYHNYSQRFSFVELFSMNAYCWLLIFFRANVSFDWHNRRNYASKMHFALEFAKASESKCQNYFIPKMNKTHTSHSKTFYFPAMQHKINNSKFGWENNFCFLSDFPFGVYVNTNGNSAIFRVLSYADGMWLPIRHIQFVIRNSVLVVIKRMWV